MSRHFFAPLISVVLQILVFFAGNATARETRGSIKEAQLFPTSMIVILTDPARFNGRFAGVQGYLSTDFEDSRLYLTKDFGDLKLQENSLSVAYARNTKILTRNFKVAGYGEKGLPQCHHHYVFLVGVFEQKTMSLSNVCEIRILK